MCVWNSCACVWNSCACVCGIAVHVHVCVEVCWGDHLLHSAKGCFLAPLTTHCDRLSCDPVNAVRATTDVIIMSSNPLQTHDYTE